MQRAGRVVGRALVEQADVGLVLEPLAQLAHQARLADPGLARRAAPPGPRRPWPAASGAAAARSPPRGRPAASGPRVWRASKRPSARPSPATRHAASGSAKPLRRCGPRSSSSNRPPTSRRVAWLITTAARLGQRLQARRQVRRLADHRLLLRRALADQVADHDQAGRDADPGRERRARRAARSRPTASTSCEPGAHRPLGIVLVRLRPAEIGQHAVAHELGDVPLEAARSPRRRRPDRRASPRACPRGRAAPTSSVEPTRSQNSTVSCRRSAARGAASGSRCASLSGRASSAIARRSFLR